MLWVVGGILIGLIAAATRGSLLDRSLMMLGLIGVSMPVYWLGEVMNLITQSRLHDTWLFSWVPPLGYKPLSSDPEGWFLTLVIPWITLATLYMGLYGRVLRANLVEAGQEDYIRTARAKGLSETRILRPPRAAHLADHDRHAVRPRFRRAGRRRGAADRGGVRPARASASSPMTRCRISICRSSWRP